jgi:hypothetical protein
MFQTFAAAFAVLIFLVPGYVWRTVEGQFVYLDRRLEWEKFALGLLARSTAVYAVFVVWVYKAWILDWPAIHPWRSTTVAVCLVGVMPSIFGVLSGILRQKEFGTALLRRAGLKTFEQHQIPTAWDYIFSRITPRWAIVTLKSGKRIFGYAGTSAYFSSDPDSRDLFLSKALTLAADGKMVEVSNSAGVYVGKDEVSVIEFVSLELPNVEKS